MLAVYIHALKNRLQPRKFPKLYERYAQCSSLAKSSERKQEMSFLLQGLLEPSPVPSRDVSVG